MTVFRDRILLPLLSTMVLASCGSGDAPPEDVRIVRTVTVAAGDDQAHSGYSGEVRARHESQIAFRVAGRVVERLVDAGARVNKGQPLARLDPVDAALNVESARAQLESARSSYAQARLDFERAEKLFARRFISQAEFDRDRVTLDSSRAQLVAAQSQYELAGNQHAYTLLRAPHEGIVTEIGVEAGEVVNAGQRAAVVAANGEREVVISIPESRLEEVRQASGLTITLWAHPGRRYAGKVREIAPMTDSATRQYTARVTIADPDANIELGMTARVHLASARGLATSYRLPLSALVQKEGKTHVWVVANDTSRVALRPVTMADMEQDAVIVGAGLKPGETVVTAGVNLLFEGQKVRLAGAEA
jgi:RND family efflux transporter MFP subunit